MKIRIKISAFEMKPTNLMIVSCEGQPAERVGEQPLQAGGH